MVGMKTNNAPTQTEINAFDSARGLAIAMLESLVPAAPFDGGVATLKSLWNAMQADYDATYGMPVERAACLGRRDALKADANRRGWRMCW